MRRGLSWDGAPKRTIAALVLAVMMVVPGSALAAPAPVDAASIGHVGHELANKGVSWSRRPDLRVATLSKTRSVILVEDDFTSTNARGVSWS